MSPSWARQRAKRFGAFITSPHPKWYWCFTLPGGKNQERNWVVQSSQASKFQMAHGFPLFYGNGRGIDNIGAPWKCLIICRFASEELILPNREKCQGTWYCPCILHLGRRLYEAVGNARWGAIRGDDGGHGKNTRKELRVSASNSVLIINNHVLVCAHFGSWITFEKFLGMYALSSWKVWWSTGLLTPSSWVHMRGSMHIRYA